MRIDHLVWYNADLAQGCNFFAGHMDREPLYGGEHPDEGTANAVMALGGQTYLEILGRDVNQGEQGLDPEVKGLRGSGLYHWAIGGIGLKDLAERAAKAGLEGGALMPGGRVKPDGKWLGWTCWGPRNHRFGSLIPFFIDWMDSEHPAISAPLGGRLARLEVHTPDAEELRRIYAILGLADIPVKESAEPFVIATIESGKGRVDLRSFAPVPRGYVI
ncbi:VOC family protein [Aestuariivirga sp.]|uniref:VOC family protein n=1 Tax=Aestuariivirga sp. TaxID=2650926 RepID=UPI0035940213